MKKTLVLAAMAFASFAMAAPTSAPERLNSGVTIVHLTQGSGAHPTATDVVKVNYRGTLINGTEFDSSARHGGPASFPLNRVVKCWTIALQAMQPGEKAHVFCPAGTAYVDRDLGIIPPNSDLAFDVELLDIVK